MRSRQCLERKRLRRLRSKQTETRQGAAMMGERGRFRPAHRSVAVFAACMLALTALLAGSAEAQRVPDPPAAIEIKAQPFTDFMTFDPRRQRFGMLEFRGGLILSSPFKHFGG